MPLDYHDFELELTTLAGAEYQIVVRSRAGEAREKSSFPFSDAELEAHLLRLENAILRSEGRRRTKLTAREEAVQKFGQQLFEFLFVGEARTLYYECQRSATHQGKGMRLKLHIQPPRLAALPWEFLHDPRRRDYICLDPHTPLVRYPELAHGIQPLTVAPPLRILGMVASPKDLQPLDVDEEKARVEDAVRPLVHRGLVALTWLAGETWRDLQQRMRPGYGPWHIFHFIGHGEFDASRDEGRVFLADEKGQPHAISATQLSRLLSLQRSSLRLVLLNACEGARGGQFDVLSSTAATLVLGGIPAVLAMQYSITDAAALEFARTFYSALADNLPVDTAVSEARNAINLQDESSLEWGTPVLYLRAADGVLFQIEEAKGQGAGVKEQGAEKEDASATQSSTIRRIDMPDGPLPLTGRQMEVLHLLASGLTDEEIAKRLYTEPGAVRGHIANIKKRLHLRYRWQLIETASRRNLSQPPIEFDWVTIPAGEFWMGSDKRKDKDASDDEKPRHRLYLTQYHIARAPVTNAQYKLFVAATGHPSPKHWQNGQIPKEKENHPVVYVSWHDTIAFCEWANVRLPSEAEWEKAARGTDGRIYPWGNEQPDKTRCNFNMDVGDTTPVGQYLKGASRFGVLDMSGNVWEWTMSLWGTDEQKSDFPYPYNSMDGREDLGAPESVRRVLRGGSFNNERGMVRCAYRVVSNFPDEWGNEMGFRVVQVASPG